MWAVVTDSCVVWGEWGQLWCLAMGMVAETAGWRRGGEKRWEPSGRRAEREA